MAASMTPKANGVRLPTARLRRTGAQAVYDALRRDIMCLDLAPGAALDEGQLCRQFKVSRTPVREALIRLASEGLAELNPNRGARVASIEFADVVDHYEAMDVFMPVACHFAAVRRTPIERGSRGPRSADPQRSLVEKVGSLCSRSRRKKSATRRMRFQSTKGGGWRRLTIYIMGQIIVHCKIFPYGLRRRDRNLGIGIINSA